MTRVVLIHAGPTHWDDEDRLVGNHPLPLTDQAQASIRHIVDGLQMTVSAVYRFSKNEACDQAARIVASRFALRPRDNAALEEVNLGLWQGLTRSELHFRFPSVFPEWEQNPLAINPPDGEPLAEAIERLRGAMKRILRRNRGEKVALSLRPMSMQIAYGLLRGQNDPSIAGHLHNASPAETIDVPDEDLRRLFG
jgi:phosphoserine phosphatase